jgi:hypothetical protein
MWTVEGQETDWPKLDSLQPERVLDFYDGPSLFTVRTADGFDLLAYRCGADRDVDRFLLVPTSEKLLADIEDNLISLREALTLQPWAWLVDRNRDGTLSRPLAIDSLKLPDHALPEEGVRLFADTDVFLRLRMIGKDIEAGHVPASVVKRAVEGATDTIKTLVRHVLGASAVAGRLSEVARRYYDLPALHFAFRSFEIAFGKPSDPAELMDAETLDQIRRLLVKGLSWAESATESVPADLTPEWTTIINALAKLAPPQKGTVQVVEVSGVLAGAEYRTVRLTRQTTRRISEARKFLSPNTKMHTDTGFVREFDKDALTFTLRNAKGEDLRLVEFSEEQYDDSLVAFDTDRIVTIVTIETVGVAKLELVSITFGSSTEEANSGLAS